MFTVATPKNRQFTHNGHMVSVAYDVCGPVGEVAVKMAGDGWFEPVFISDERGCLTEAFTLACRLIEAGSNPNDFIFRWNGWRMVAEAP